MKRKILSLILCVLMCLSLMPMAAAEGSTAESTEPAETAQPTDPIEPIEPVEPVEPSVPIEPSVPEEAQPEDDVSPAASETDKIILPAPTELTWGKLYDSDGVPYDIPGAMSCRISTPEVSHVEFELYDADTDMQINHPGSYRGFHACSGYCCSYVHDLFEAFELDSGRYYFKARCTPHFEDEAQYLPSDWVRSEVWTYVKPSQRLNACTDLSLDNKSLSFTLPANADMLLGMEVELWYSPVENGKYRMLSATRYSQKFLYHSGLKDGMKYDSFFSALMSNSGYYKVRVRLTSRDITKYCGSGWSEYSNAIYQPCNDNSGECFSNLEELIALCSRDSTDYTVAYYQPAAGSNEAFSISSDLTIPKLLEISFGNADVVIPKGATLTIDGNLSVYSYNGLSISGNIILNEDGVLDIYNAEVSAGASITNNGGIVVTDTMSFDNSSCYSGNGPIYVYDTYGNDSPFSQLPGLEPSSFFVDYQADFSRPAWYLRPKEDSTIPSECFSNLEELIALCSRDFTDYTFACYQPAAGSSEVFSISSDLTIPELLEIGFDNADVVIPKGATLTMDGFLSVYSHNGLFVSGNIILNEDAGLDIYNAEVSAGASITNNGIIGVTDTMSFDGSSCYSGNGFILVYDTYGNDSPFSQLPGLEPSSFFVDYRDDFINPGWLLQPKEASTTPGDVNGDGVVNVLDLVRLQKFLSGEDVSLVDADFNGDGVINVLDLLRLKKFLAGMDVTLN